MKFNLHIVLSIEYDSRCIDLYIKEQRNSYSYTPGGVFYSDEETGWGLGISTGAPYIDLGRKVLWLIGDEPWNTDMEIHACFGETAIADNFRNFVKIVNEEFGD